MATMNDAAFAYLRSELERHTGVVLSEQKRYLVKARLSAVLSAHGLADIDALVAALRAERSPVLRAAVIDALTTHHTSFFRDKHPFENLRARILPDLIAARARSRQLSIWCAAASSGQEPYSLALLLCELSGRLRGWQVRLLATDVSEHSIERAQEGSYTADELKALPREYRHHFKPSGEKLQLAQDVRSMVEFRVLNLAGPWRMMPHFDLILMRNVLIYFSDATKRDILLRAGRQLRAGGYLMLGSTETTRNLAPEYECVTVGRTSLYTFPTRRAA